MPDLLGLSDEVLLHILSYLPSIDLIQCCQVCRRLAALARDKTLTRSLDFYLETRLTPSDLKTYVNRTVRDSIQKLNLSSLYWFPAQDLRFVSSCKQLTYLNIMDTKLKLQDIEKILQTLQYLDSIAFSLETSEVESFKKVYPQIKNLAIYFRGNRSTLERSLTKVFPGLEVFRFFTLALFYLAYSLTGRWRLTYSNGKRSPPEADEPESHQSFAFVEERCCKALNSRNKSRIYGIRMTEVEFKSKASMDEMLQSVGECTNLQILILRGLIIPRGVTFFDRLLKSCPKLTSLFISMDGRPQNSFSNLAAALKQSSIQRFALTARGWLENDRVLIDSLASCDSLRMCSLVELSQAFERKFDVQRIKKIVDNNPQLQFFFLGTKSVTNADAKQINRHMTEVRKKRPFFSGLVIQLKKSAAAILKDPDYAQQAGQIPDCSKHLLLEEFPPFLED